MLKRVRLVTLIALAATASCGNESKPTREWTPNDHSEPSGPGGNTNTGQAAPSNSEPVEATPEAAAASLFRISCAGCHGGDGRSGGPGLPPGAQVPDFTSPAWQTSRSDADLAQAILRGKGVMPAFDQLNDTAVQALVRHVRAFGQE